jgi:acyl-lipid omega-6 desaturase (Delta-12 desaturase)
MASVEPLEVTVVEKTSRELHKATRPFSRESTARSWWYVVSTFFVLGACVAAAVLLPWWPARLVASVFVSLLIMRTFILYHDFMHGSILPGSRLARAIFYCYAAVNLTPPRSWRDSHNFHHANVGLIEGSNTGSFPIMTTAMWRSASAWERLRYRIVRHPATILLAYVTVFAITVTLMPLLRRPSRYWDSALALLSHAAVIVTLWLAGGFDAALFGILLPMTFAGALGAYLFYSQHSFPELDILPHTDWSAYEAAVASSSFLRVGPIMRWFTGNIGFHHVHHLNSLIPFYRLPQAMEAIPELQDPAVTTLTPRDVIACFRASLWDEATGRMVRYKDA